MNVSNVGCAKHTVGATQVHLFVKSWVMDENNAVFILHIPCARCHQWCCTTEIVHPVKVQCLSRSTAGLGHECP